MALPTISPEQREKALASALESRKARAAALDQVRKGNLTLADVLGDEDSPLQKAYVRQVLLALPRVGPVKADQVMEEIIILPNRRIQGLRHRQREALLARFPA